MLLNKNELQMLHNEIKNAREIFTDGCLLDDGDTVDNAFLKKRSLKIELGFLRLAAVTSKLLDKLGQL